MRTNDRLIAVLLLAGLCGCADSAASPQVQQGQEPVVFITVVNDAESNPQSVDMAMKFAGFALDEQRKVVMFFTVKGVRVPGKQLADDFTFGSNRPIKEQLAGIIGRGAEVHVCPVCMKELGVVEDDLVSGAKVTTRPGLFAHIHGDTTVFTF